MRKDKIIEFFKDKKIVIVGFGREGISAYKLIRKHYPKLPLTIADRSPLIHLEDFPEDKHLKIVAGEEYDQNLNQYEVILKSPGVNFNNLNYFIPKEKFVTQTELFLMAYGDNVIGVTGTKGKSTTASLIYHILSNSVGNTVLAGNIGTPFQTFLMLLPSFRARKLIPMSARLYAGARNCCCSSPRCGGPNGSPSAKARRSVIFQRSVPGK